MYPGGRLLEDSVLVLFLGAEGGEVGDAFFFEPGCMPREACCEDDLGGFFLSALRGSTPCRVARGVSPLYVARWLRRRGGGRLVALAEKGGPLEAPGEGDVLLLGTHRDPPARLVEAADARASVGPFSYLASHVAAYVNAVRLGLLKP
jgi:tRNA (pseudouridine54-N1)-methyltransferase